MRNYNIDQHEINVKAKQLKNVLAAQQDEVLREATALYISNISFDYKETVVKKEEMEIKEEEEEEPPKPYLSEAGPSNLNSGMTSKCYICDKNFNQYDLEVHFVTDHFDSGM